MLSFPLLNSVSLSDSLSRPASPLDLFTAEDSITNGPCVPLRDIFIFGCSEVLLQSDSCTMCTICSVDWFTRFVDCGSTVNLNSSWPGPGSIQTTQHLSMSSLRGNIKTNSAIYTTFLDTFCEKLIFNTLVLLSLNKSLCKKWGIKKLLSKIFMSSKKMTLRCSIGSSRIYCRNYNKL